MRILLLHPPLWTLKSPPLNVPYLAAVARRAGHEVLSIDANAEWFRASDVARRRYWQRTDQFRWESPDAFTESVLPEVVLPLLPGLLKRSIEFAPDLIGITTNSRQLTAVLGQGFADSLPGVPVVSGGQTCFPGFHGREHLESGRFVAVVYGEGEQTFLEIADRLASGRSLAGTAGALVLQEGEVVDGGPRAPIADLDSLPFPDFSDLDLDHYTEQMAPPYEASGWLTVLSSRGCTGICDFCLQRVIWASKYRQRSAASVLAEMDHGNTLYGCTKFHFNDLALNNHRRHLMSMCDQLIERGSPYIWGGNANIHRYMDGAYALKIHTAGCRFLTFGIEAASDSVLHAMGKPYTAVQMADTLRGLNDVGIRVFTNLVIGHPSEGPAEFDETVEFMRRNADAFREPPSSSLCLIQRGTPLHDQCDDYGVFVDGGDSAGWYALDGTSDLDERRRRAAVLDDLYKELWGRGIRMTDRNDPRCSPQPPAQPSRRTPHPRGSRRRKGSRAMSGSRRRGR